MEETGGYCGWSLQIWLKLGIQSDCHHHPSSLLPPKALGPEEIHDSWKQSSACWTNICLLIPDVNKDSSYLQLTKCRLFCIKLNNFNKNYYLSGLCKVNYLFRNKWLCPRFQVQLSVSMWLSWGLIACFYILLMLFVDTSLQLRVIKYFSSTKRNL